VVPRHKSYPGNTLLMAFDGVDLGVVSLTSVIATYGSEEPRDDPRPLMDYSSVGGRVQGRLRVEEYPARRPCAAGVVLSEPAAANA
jgi:hypothetical protein